MKRKFTNANKFIQSNREYKFVIAEHGYGRKQFEKERRNLRQKGTIL